ncbi:hypothetical protein BV25DRAFT_1890871 [Artomyces pyxidatus]|uniref:Uncharacterized protein n=1 Tax=Artomyces pyxidatus TaxID=48021 RepID=A0ACB8SSE6_9AGAM|nr:hypothetical protein BV25DRAFT_1890871 [Artomyces pyxidatus]
MRGLPFPQGAAFDRETSYEYGTPISNVDEIPIDPALAGPPIDPALSGWESVPAHIQNGFQALPPGFTSQHPEYSQGPQGDPFAPAPPPLYFAPESQEPPPSKPVKKKRKVRRERECGFCQGNDKKNSQGEPEAMVSCDECGRSGHPTCMDLGEIGDQLHSYTWSCIECKKCEICREKGDDDRILFCDSCDRGWHLDCLTPPMEESPPGKFYCPACTGNPAGECAAPEQDPAESEVEPDGTVRESSVASTSRAPRTRRKSTNKKGGKRKAETASESEDNPSDTPTQPRGRTRRAAASSPRKSARGQENSVSPSKRPSVQITAPPKRMVVRLRIPPQSKGKEKEESSDEEPPKGLFDEMLTPEERDTTKTKIASLDKVKFDRSRQTAELLAATVKQPITIPDTPTAGPSSRPLRSTTLAMPPTPVFNLARSVSPTPSTPITPSVAPSGLRIRTIRFGQYDIQTWYDAPFPEEYANIPDGRLWICEFCLKYNKSRFGAARHCLKCKARHPPGDEIYRDGAVSIFEVDGRRNKIYCQNLCLLSKMFLDHKSLFYDVEPFLFYVMTEVDDGGSRFVGYFSKEKRSPKDYNVSCIMTLPVRQRQGWGNLLIEFSYLLSKKEQRLGSPEKPLSGLGALGYKNYWTLAIMRYLQKATGSPRLEDVSRATSMTLEDVYNTLLDQDLIAVDSLATPRPLPGQAIKFPKGRKNGFARRHLIRTQTQDDETNKSPFVPPNRYEIQWDRAQVDAYLAKWESKGYLKIKPEKLKWSPFLLARVKKSDAAEVRDDSISAPDAAALASSSSLAETPTPVTPGFDGHDDNVAVPRRSSRSSSKGETRSPEQATTRRLRSRARVSPERRNTAPSLSPSRPMRPLRTRSTSTRTSYSPMKIDSFMDEDAALAARLAMEDRPMRMLRSRSATSPELQRSVSSHTKIATRKRRRIDSSPEPDAPAAPAEEETKLISADARLPASRSPTIRPQLNGYTEAPAISPELEEPMDVDANIPDNRSPTYHHLPTTNDLSDTRPASPLHRTSGINGFAAPPDAHEDNRSEFDSGTPFTAVLSRHSAPSDDTVYAPGAASSKGDVDSPAEVAHSAVEMEEAERPMAIINAEDLQYHAEGDVRRVNLDVGEPELREAVIDAGVNEAEVSAVKGAVIGEEVDADADAEGEDVDAEGEDADAEGEDDDAEGEPDTEL